VVLGRERQFWTVLEERHLWKVEEKRRSRFSESSSKHAARVPDLGDTRDLRLVESCDPVQRVVLRPSSDNVLKSDLS
jgi:hypothetical protein